MSIPDARLHMAFGQRADDARLHLDELTLGEVVGLLTTHREGSKDGRYFVPAKFHKPYRDKDNVATWSGCCIDIDRDTSREEIETKLVGVAWIAHSTYKSGRARVFVPYGQPVPTPTHQKIAAKLNRLVGAVDACNEKRLQFFYLPACAPGAERWAAHTVDRSPLLHPLKFLAAPAPPPADNLAHVQTPRARGGYTDWLRDLLDGENLHDNARGVAGSMVYRGMDKPTILAVFHALRGQLTEARGPDRVRDLFDGELDRMIDGAIENRAKASPTYSLPDFDELALRESAEEMFSEMDAQEFAWPRIAIMGQLTTFFGAPNVGKTLLLLNGIARQVRAGKIDGENVFYVNADDNARGVAEKQRIARDYGFRQLVPGRNGFRAAMLIPMLRQRVATGRARGLVVIVDTVKKFTDPMSKKESSQWGAAAREAVSAGATIIALGHVNKHRDADGQSVHAGTTDLGDDSDAAFILELKESNEDRRTVLIRKIKARGDVDDETMLTYANHGSYWTRFDSVTTVGEADREAIEAKRQHEERLAKDQEYIAAIREQIQAGITLRTEIVKGARGDGLGRRALIKVLDRYTGKNPQCHLWRASPGEKNSRHYSLLTRPLFEHLPGGGGGAGETGQFGKSGNLAA